MISIDCAVGADQNEHVFTLNRFLFSNWKFIVINMKVKIVDLNNGTVKVSFNHSNGK